MSISNAAYADLEAAVGPRYVSRDIAIIAGNGWNNGVAKNKDHPNLPDQEYQPIAVVLPSTVEEVAAVVKACNKHNIHFRALSVGWGNFGGVTRTNSITIDLRRMDHCEIDAPNQMAVIGPYVTAGELMAEAMKHGLTTHVVGAGPTHSPLASATNGWGIGISGTSTGFNGRNLLSLEWVTPEGEIVRLGSAGSDLGWHISDGPGPSFRGMIRGFMGAVGGLGVFTRIGYRLHPWHGPKRLEFTGKHPQIGMRIDDNFVRFYQGVWPTWEGVQKAAAEFNVSGVTTVQLRMPPEHIAWTLTATNNDYYRMVNQDDLPAVARQENGCSWSILSTAYSEKHDKYNDSVIKQIIERTGGRILEVEPEYSQVLARALATSCYIPRVLRPSIMIGTSFGLMESQRTLPRAIEATKAMYADCDLAKNYFHTVGTEQNWTWPTERRWIWTENIMIFNVGKPEVGGAMMEALLYQEHLLETRRLGVSGFLLGPALDLIGPRWGPNAHNYCREIKNSYDPGNHSDPFFSISAEPMPGADGWKFAKKVLFRPVMRPVLRKMSRKMAKRKL